MSGISDVNPFVGPRPIQRGEALHGRRTEVRELYEQLQARRIVVLHSPSGAGKSSLVHAGLVPRLAGGKFFDVWNPIRVNLDVTGFEGLPEGVNRYLLSAMLSLEDELPAKRRRSPAELAKLSFLDYLDNRPRRKSREHSVVLLFDQFEEILSVAPRDVDGKRAFFDAVGEALDTERYWALFIIREDYLAALAPYRERIPTQLSNTFRLDLLGLAGAREAALELAKEGGRSFTAVDKLVHDLSMVKVQRSDGSFVVEQGLHVEPVYLQVVCRRLWDAMPADALTIDDEHIEAHGDITVSLAAYYSDAVRTIAGDDAAAERRIRDWVGNKLIVGGIRSQIRQERGASGGLDNHYVEQLLDCYLVRTEQRAGANWFELSHDRLVEPIQQDNEAWEQTHLHPLQVQAKLWEDGGRARALLYSAEALPSALSWAKQNPELVTPSEAKFLELSSSLRKTQRQQRIRQRRVTAVISAVAVVAIAFGGIALSMRFEAERQRQEAEDATQAAEEEKRRAEIERNNAKEERDKAQQAQDKAEEEKRKAERLRAENVRSVRQMFEVSLRPFVEHLAGSGAVTGAVEVDARWTSLLEHEEQPIVAATVGGEHRVVVAATRSILSEVNDQGESLFLEITAKWLLADQARRGVTIVTQEPERSKRLQTAKRALAALGYECLVDSSLANPAALEHAGMLIIDDRWTALSASEVGALEAFVKRGGGVLAVGEGARFNKEVAEAAGASVDGYPMNELLEGFGVRWTERTMSAGDIVKREDATVRFENKWEGAVDLFTRSRSGQEEYYTSLELGEDRELLTHITQVWVIRDAKDGDELLVAKIDEKQQYVAIEKTPTGKPKSKPKPVNETKPDSSSETEEAPDGTPKRKPAEKPKTLTSADMGPGLAAAKKAALACGKEYESVEEFVEVKFEVAPSGEVARANALKPMNTTPDGQCAADAVRALKFPDSQDGIEQTWKLRLY